MIRKRLLQVLLFQLCVAATITAQSFRDEVRDHWKDRVFVLKTCCDKYQLFDQNGEPQFTPRAGETGPSVILKSFKLTDELLEIRAETVEISFNEQRPFGTFAGNEYRITIRFDHPPQSYSELDSALGKVFLPFQVEDSDRLPDYMQTCARGHIRAAGRAWRCEFPGVRVPGTHPGMKDSGSPTVQEEVDFQLVGGHYAPEKLTVYSIGPERGVTPPKARFDPDPTYTSVASAAKINACVLLRAIIDEQGRTDHIQVIGPVGYGLDHNAVQAVRSWRFEPANHHGTRVPVSVLIEVNFRIS